MKYPHFHFSEATLLVIPVVALFVLLFNAYRMGQFSKQNRHYRLWRIGGILFTLLILGFSIFYIGNQS